jgi:hypothetical protein
MHKVVPFETGCDGNGTGKASFGVIKLPALVSGASVMVMWTSLRHANSFDEQSI